MSSWSLLWTVACRSHFCQILAQLHRQYKGEVPKARYVRSMVPSATIVRTHLPWTWKVIDMSRKVWNLLAILTQLSEENWLSTFPTFRGAKVMPLLKRFATQGPTMKILWVPDLWCFGTGTITCSKVRCHTCTDHTRAKPFNSHQNTTNMKQNTPKSSVGLEWCTMCWKNVSNNVWISSANSESQKSWACTARRPHGSGCSSVPPIIWRCRFTRRCTFT